MNDSSVHPSEGPPQAFPPGKIPVSPQHAALNPITAAQVDAIFAPWNRSDSPGCALAVMHGGRIVYQHGYGMADLSHDVIITPSTPFHAASVSKQFAAAALVLLDADGKLSLEDDVRDYVAELPDFGARIRIRHLIQHTSGLRDQWELLNFAGYRYSLDLITDEDVMSLVVRQTALNFPPGSQHLYCNTGYTLLGQIVKRVTGLSLREFTTQRIFEPLAMASTHFRDDHAEINKGEALGYERAKDGSYRLSVTNFDTVGATSLYTTVEDLAKWEENFYTQAVGGAEFTRRMTRTDPLTTGKENRYAMGLMTGSYRGLAIVEHSGADAGYRAHLIRFPQQHFSVAILCNTVMDACALSRQVADICLRESFTQPPPPVCESSEPMRLERSNLEVKVGFYLERDTGVLLQLSAGDGVLEVSMGDDEKQALCSDGQGTFWLPVVAQPARFEPAAGEARRLLVERDGQAPQIWDRLPACRIADRAMRQWVGTYYSEELDTLYRIDGRHGHLVLTRKRYHDQPLAAAGRDLFAMSCQSNWWMMTAIRFERDAAGRVSAMLLTSARCRNVRFTRQQGSEN